MNGVYKCFIVCAFFFACIVTSCTKNDTDSRWEALNVTESFFLRTGATQSGGSLYGYGDQGIKFSGDGSAVVFESSGCVTDKKVVSWTYRPHVSTLKLDGITYNVRIPSDNSGFVLSVDDLSCEYKSLTEAEASAMELFGQ